MFPRLKGRCASLASNQGEHRFSLTKMAVKHMLKTQPPYCRHFARKSDRPSPSGNPTDRPIGRSARSVPVPGEAPGALKGRGANEDQWPTSGQRARREDNLAFSHFFGPGQAFCPKVPPFEFFATQHPRKTVNGGLQVSAGAWGHSSSECLSSVVSRPFAHRRRSSQQRRRRSLRYPRWQGVLCGNRTDSVVC